jgi:aldose sugar dehydrogenase
VFLLLVTLVGMILVSVILASINDTIYFTYAQVNKLPKVIMANASHFSVELVYKGLNNSNIAFLGPNDMLILDRNDGKVYRIMNGRMLENPLIDLNSFHQDGLIGIATEMNQNGPPYIFLYLNEAPVKYGSDVND